MGLKWFAKVLLSLDIAKLLNEKSVSRQKVGTIFAKPLAGQ